ncbi:MAG: hypothetical protein LUQ69_06540 [Methanoregulaceae archaeon]|nr:hypothetical protein [Methanoregulaceae archaeon]
MKTAAVGILVLTVCLVACGTATTTVGNVGIIPNSDLISGETKVSVSFVVDFPASGGETFANQDSLQLSTDLTDAHWTPVLIIDGVANQRPEEVGGNIAISGWELSYPGDRDLMLKVNMEGTAPVVNTSQNKTILRVVTLNAKGGTTAGTEVIRTRYVINPSEMRQIVTGGRAELQAFKTLLDQNAAQGIDISAAQAKYAEADGALQSAEKSSSFVVQKGYVTTAEAAITAGKALLEKASAQKVITDANGLIDQTDSLITYFKVNRSMGSDPRLQPIIVKRELAAGLLSEANDYNSQGQYSQAMVKASEALNKGQDALNDATALKEDVGANPFTSIVSTVSGGVSGALMYIAIIVVIAVIAVVGIVLYRRRNRWDELG